MQVSSIKIINPQYNLYKKNTNNSKQRTNIPKYVYNSLSFLSNYKRVNVSFGRVSGINLERLQELQIPNIHIIDNDCVRGESLSSKKNRKFLIPVKKCGIEDIIDLRDKYTSNSYEDLCEQYDLKYHHIPVDSGSIDDNEIIKNLPELFSVLNKGKAYIACAQGLHRTDIALALNYIFNPLEQKEPPKMYGHFRDYGFKCDDILRRFNSINKKLSDEDLFNLGWTTENPRAEIIKRKNELVDYNKSYQNK